VKCYIRIGNNNTEGIQRRHLANRITLTITINVIYVLLCTGEGLCDICHSIDIGIVDNLSNKFVTGIRRFAVKKLKAIAVRNGK